MRRFSLFLFAFIIVFSFSLPTSASDIFKDVGTNHHTYKEFDYLVKHGALTADPTKEFGVQGPITRIEASEIIVNALKLDTIDRPAPDLVDVSKEDEHYDIIATIIDEGIMDGNEKKEFNKNASLTRGQMAKILTLGFDLEGTSDYSFRDVPNSIWPAPYIKTLFANQITTGYNDNTYRPYQATSKMHFVVFLARILEPNLNETVACQVPNNQLKHAIDVSVTNLWHFPNQARVLDRPSVAKPVDMDTWTKSLTLQDKWWLIDRTDTQALYGDEVEIIRTSGNWVRVAVKNQKKTGHNKGYEGWVPKTHVTSYYPNYEDCAIAIVDANLAMLYNSPSTKSPFMKISYATILPVVNEDSTWYHVQTPSDGVKYLAKHDARAFDNYAAVPKPTQADIINSAKQFMGLPYVWAGASGFGFDCSGIIYSVYKNHGIMIPRDSFVQATHGRPVAKSNMQPGDLMFFAYNGGRGKVYHVSLYLGDGKMLHAPNSSRTVEIISINQEPYKQNFSGARRYLN